MIKRFILNWIHRNAFEIRQAMAIPTLPKNPPHFDELRENALRQQARAKKQILTARELFSGTAIFIITAVLLYGCNALPAKARDESTHPAIREWKRDGCPLPMHPISHRRDGTLIVGNGTAFE